jgi:hypothetical protein
LLNLLRDHDKSLLCRAADEHNKENKNSSAVHMAEDEDTVPDPKAHVRRHQPPPTKSSYQLKPVIREIARTRVTRDPVTLLIDRIQVCATSAGRDGKRAEAFRLWVSDGEKSMQAILARDAHPFITAFNVRAGCFVSVTRYEVLELPKLNGKGHVLYVTTMMEIS